MEFNEENIEIKTAVPKIPEPRDISPWADQTPTRILEREYPSGTVILTSASPQLTEVIPNICGLVSTFNDAMKSFRYIRWKFLKWRYQIVANVQTYGQCGFTCLPIDTRRSSSTSTALSLDYGWLSHTDCQMADFSTSNSGEIIVPWLSYNKWLDWAKAINTGYPIGFTEVTRLNNLKVIFLTSWINSLDSSVAKQATINTWVSLHGVEVAGPRIYNTVGDEVEMQSYYDDDYIWETPIIFSDEPLWLRSTSDATESDSSTEDIAEMQATAFGTALYTMAQSEMTKYLATSGVSHVKNAMASGFHMADEYLGNFFEFDDPVEEKEAAPGSTDIVPNIYGDVNYSRPRNLIGTGTMVLPRKFRGHSWLNLIKRPCYYGSQIISSTGTQNFTVSGWPFTIDTALASNAVPRCTWLDYASQFFRLWRGSFYYVFRFVSSPLVTQKVAIYISYTGSSYTNIREIGDVVTEIIEIKGTTEKKILIPYLYTNPYQYTQSTNSTTGIAGEAPFIKLFVYSNTANAGDTTPVIITSYWQMAADDFVFFGPRDPQYEQEPAVEMQCSIASFSALPVNSQFMVHESSVPVWPDESVTVEQMATRWSCRSALDPEALNYLSGIDRFSWNVADCVRCIAFYNRGQYKVKATFDPAAFADPQFQGVLAKLNPDRRNTVNPTHSYQQRLVDGSVIISSGLTQMMEYTVPYYSNSEWIPVWTSEGFFGEVATLSLASLYGIGASETTPALNFCATAMGDDFVMSYILPPPYSASRWYLTTEPPPLVSIEESMQMVDRQQSKSVSVGNDKDLQLLVRKYLAEQGLETT